MMRLLGFLSVAATLAACGVPPQPVSYQPAPRPEQEPAWRVSCQADRFTDRDRCEVSRRLSSQQLGIAEGSIWTLDAGRTWTITVAPPPAVYRLRVGQNAVIEGPCRGPAGACSVANSAQLTAQMRGGTTMAVQITTVRGGQIDRDISLAGLPEALAEAERRSPPGAPRR